jgi:hypothetical protein
MFLFLLLLRAFSSATFRCILKVYQFCIHCEGLRNDLSRSTPRFLTSSFQISEFLFLSNPVVKMAWKISRFGHFGGGLECMLHNLRVAFSSQIKSKVSNILVKVATLRVTLNIDGTPIPSKSHTHPSHSQTSRLLTSSLSLGVPIPHSTKCMWDV